MGWLEVVLPIEMDISNVQPTCLEQQLQIQAEPPASGLLFKF